MSVSRSALASSAARSACAGSRRRPCAGDRRGDGRTRSDAIALAAELAVVDHLVERGHARLERAACGPGRRRTSRRPGAAARRARCLRSMRAGSAGAMLLTMRKRLVSLPRASSSGKYFWFAFIVRTRHSGGTARNSALEVAGEHVRPLDQRRDFVEQRVVVDRREPAPTRRPRCSWRTISARRSSKPAITAPSLAQLLLVAVGVAQLDRRAARLEAVALRRATGLEAERATGTTSAPCSATRPCAGRTNCTLVQPSASWYCMTFGIGSCASASSSAPAGLRERDALRRRGRGTALRPCRRRGACSCGTHGRVGAERRELLDERRRRPRPSASRPTLAGISFCDSARSARLRGDRP